MQLYVSNNWGIEDSTALDEKVQTIVEQIEEDQRWRNVSVSSEEERCSVFTDLLGEAYERGFSNGYGNTIRGQTHRLKTLATEVINIISQNVAAFELKEEDVEHKERLILGVTASDLGKLLVDENILTKEGSLDTRERKEIEKHPQFSAYLIYHIMKGLHFSDDASKEVATYALQHHERYDGKTDERFYGYPQGLSGNEISFGGRLAAVIDVADAILGGRHYRLEQSYGFMITELLRSAGVELHGKRREIWEQEIRARHEDRKEKMGEEGFRNLIIERLDKDYGIYDEKLHSNMSTDILQNLYIDKRAEPEQHLDPHIVLSLIIMGGDAMTKLYPVEIDFQEVYRNFIRAEPIKKSGVPALAIFEQTNKL